MFNKIKSYFKSSFRSKDFPSHIKFKANIKALAMEVYKNITIIYLSKPTNDPNKDPEDTDLIYHIFHNKEFYFKTADTLEALEELAHSDIDSKFKNS